MPLPPPLWLLLVLMLLLFARASQRKRPTEAAEYFAAASAQQQHRGTRLSDMHCSHHQRKYGENNMHIIRDASERTLKIKERLRRAADANIRRKFPNTNQNRFTTEFMLSNHRNVRRITCRMRRGIEWKTGFHHRSHKRELRALSHTN